MHLANINISTQAVSDIISDIFFLCAERKIPEPVTSLFLLQKLDFLGGKVSPLFRDPVSFHFTVSNFGPYSTNHKLNGAMLS